MKNFPMFLRMTGRRVLVLGGDEQAAQKTRLVLKTEAQICVVADKLCTELAELATEGRIKHLDQDVTVDLLKTANLVFSATGCAGAGACHAALAHEANSIINVVDMPELCEAMTPSIVDRDPLVIAIGTEGAAPILGRQLKSKIEASIEPQLGQMVAFAGRMRKDVAHYIPQANRRGFWNWVFNGSPRKEFSKGNERRSFELIRKGIVDQSSAQDGAGTLSFITAAMPQADLMRLRDVRNLQEADVIFYERGLHEEILELARRDAERHVLVPDGQDPEHLLRVFTNPLQEGLNVVVLSVVDLEDVLSDLIEGKEPSNQAI